MEEEWRPTNNKARRWDTIIEVSNILITTESVGGRNNR